MENNTLTAGYDASISFPKKYKRFYLCCGRCVFLVGYQVVQFCCCWKSIKKLHHCLIIWLDSMLPVTTEGLSSSRRLGALFRLLLYSSSFLGQGACWIVGAKAGLVPCCRWTTFPLATNVLGRRRNEVEEWTFLGGDRDSIGWTRLLELRLLRLELEASVAA